MTFLYPFFFKLSVGNLVGNLHISTSQFGLARFHMLTSHMYLVATKSGSGGLEQRLTPNKKSVHIH